MRFEVFRPHCDGGLKHLHVHHVTHHSKQTYKRNIKKICVIQKKLLNSF